MNTNQKPHFFRRAGSFLINSQAFVLSIWLFLGVVSPFFKRFMRGEYNNYVVFKSSYLHLLKEMNLYASYASEGMDVFLYGPLFSALMAPFAMLPDALGCLLFLTLSALALYYAIQSLPMSQLAKNGMCMLCIVEYGNNQQHFQFNGVVAALIIFAFVSFVRQRERTAAASVILGIFTKLYGIIALPFAMFSKRKGRVVLYLALFALVAFSLPILFSSPQFLLDSYPQWAEGLASKHLKNMGMETFQDRSVAGLARRLTGNPDFPHGPLLLVGCVAFCIPYLRHWNRYSERFQLLALSCSLMFVVLFSSSSENPTYIVLQCGAALWCVAGSGLSKRTRGYVMAAVIIFSSLSPTDAYPELIRDFYGQYALRVIPCLVVWFIIVWEMIVSRRDVDPRPREA